MSIATSWSRVLADLPLVAILRGIAPAEAENIAEVLEASGFLCVEVPLNSPNALQSIERIRELFDGKLLVGAGTVLSIVDVLASHAAGAELIVSPNTHLPVIHAAKDRGLISIPGFLTPTEAFAAIDAGADAVKLFPAENAPPAVLRALKAVIPMSYPVLPVGGITPLNMDAFVAAGAAGFGIGSALYSANISPAEVQERARAFVEAWQTCRN